MLIVMKRGATQEQVDAVLSEGEVVMLTDRYAPVDQMLAPVFREEVLP